MAGSHQDEAKVFADSIGGAVEEVPPDLLRLWAHAEPSPWPVPQDLGARPGEECAAPLDNLEKLARSSSREVRISWYPFCSVYFWGGTLPQKRVKRALVRACPFACLKILFE